MLTKLKRRRQRTKGEKIKPGEKINRWVHFLSFFFLKKTNLHLGVKENLENTRKTPTICQIERYK
jgi:hypothetical protein